MHCVPSPSHSVLRCQNVGHKASFFPAYSGRTDVALTPTVTTGNTLVPGLYLKWYVPKTKFSRVFIPNP